MLALAVPLSLVALVAARLHHSRVPEDPYAFPKYRVSFLNGLPLLNQTAQRWLVDGLRGGEAEFLDQPWQGSPWPANPLKGIESSDDALPDPALAQDAKYTLQQMKLGPKSSYLCLIPPPPKETPPVEEAPTEVATPVHSWALLQPLSGTCLYHRQGWFTYSYCHNSHVRQFHELHHQQIPSTGEYKPEEDPEWEAYMLGRAPPTLEAGAELTPAEVAAAANLELARGAGSRYLVQRWGEGTYCDKMGRKREVEIQFHCSMTMTDTILFVKETQTCHYVLHIATPRLCGEPGFKSRIDAEEDFIRCREVVGPEEYDRVDRELPEAAQPIKRARAQKKVLAPPPPAEASPKSKEDLKMVAHSDILRKALERILARQEGGAEGDSHLFVERLPDGEGDFVVEFVDIDVDDLALEDAGEFYDDTEGEGEGEGAGEPVLLGDDFADYEERLAEILRAAGRNLRRKGEKANSDSRSNPRSDASDDDEEAAEAAVAAGSGKGRAKGRAKKPREEL
ncbi:hypothetical protein C8Q74DRAFT_63887 [Fomes fomentarius]|nr:hypothetical protein C8Q74DRAFT_63887 [Fomes fomentarius]